MAAAGSGGPTVCCLPPLSHADLQELQALYEWVDSVPLSRPKKNIARDFADGGEEAGRAGGGQPLHLPGESVAPCI